MKSSKQILTNDHPKTFSKREDKKSVSINWNSRLYFQVGLIVSLLAVFLVMESTFGLTINRDVAETDRLNLIENENPFFELEKAKEIPVKKKVKKKSEPKRQKVTSLISKVPNTSITETTLGSTEVEPDVPLILSTNIVNEKSTKTMNVLGVEFAPIFPGCESYSTNKERIDCMSTKINSFIRNKFRTDSFSDLNSGSKHIIYCEFKIDKKGDVIDIKTITNHYSLEKEATRVIGNLPKMTPGKQGDRNVDVVYRVPIKFKVE